MKRSPKFWAGLLVVGCAALWLVHLIGMNLFLSLDGLEGVINSKQSDIRLTFEDSWTWWPGDVRVDKLVIEGADDSVEWRLDVDTANVDVGLTRLLDREFHVETATISGVRFWLRFARPLEKLCQRPSVPPIPGLASPTADDCTAQKETYSPPEPPSPDEGKSWRVHLRGLGVHDVRDVWVDRGRLRGDIAAYGEWYFAPSKALSFDRARLVTGTSTATWDQIARLRASSIRGSVTSTTIDLEKDDLPTAFDKLALTLVAKGRLDIDTTSLTVRDAATEVDFAFVPAGRDTLSGSVETLGLKASLLGLKVDGDAAARLRIVGGPRRYALASGRVDLANTRITADADVVAASWGATVTGESNEYYPRDAWLSSMWKFRELDARPFAHVAAQQSGVPAWFLDAFMGESATGAVEVARAPDTWVARGDARLGDLNVKARGHTERGVTADFLFSNSGLALTLQIRPSGTNILFDAATKRFQQETAASYR